jgi:hypothetical protein
MKPILDWTKSKAEAYAPGAAPIQFSPFELEFQRLPAVEGAADPIATAMVVRTILSPMFHSPPGSKITSIRHH